MVGETAANSQVARRFPGEDIKALVASLSCSLSQRWLRVGVTKLPVMELLPFDEFEELKKRFGSSVSLFIDLEKMPEETSRQLLAALNLPLERGMSRETVHAIFGPNDAVDIFSHSHRAYEFTCGEKWIYSVFCTIEVEQGLGLVAVGVRR